MLLYNDIIHKIGHFSRHTIWRPSTNRTEIRRPNSTTCVHVFRVCVSRIVHKSVDRQIAPSLHVPSHKGRVPSGPSIPVTPQGIPPTIPAIPTAFRGFKRIVRRRARWTHTNQAPPSFD